MILLYHNIKLKSKDSLSVGILSFIFQLLSLRQKQFVYLDNYNPQNKNHVVITFDDGYKSVLNVAWILNLLNLPFEVFIYGKGFELGEDGNKDYLNNDDLKKIKKFGGRLQYHSYSHKNLEKIEDEIELHREIQTPDYIKKFDTAGFKWFAYPFCNYNQKIVEIVSIYYKGARSGKDYGDDTSPLTLKSTMVYDKTRF